MKTKEQKGKNSRHWYNMESPVLNVLVAGLCISGFVASLLLFRSDFIRSRQTLSEKPVGTISLKMGSIQRLSSGRKQWERLNAHAHVYNGDTIAVSEYAGALIQFSNGEVLEIDRNTAARILYRDESISGIEIIKGKIAVITDRFSVTVMPGGDGEWRSSGLRAAINPKTRVSMSVSEDRRFRVNVFQGTASVNNSSAGMRRLAAGESLLAGDNGNFLDSPAVFMLSPQDGSRILTNKKEQQPLEFFWRSAAPEGDGNIHLEISNDKKFNKIVNAFSGPGPVQVNLEPGTYYWRLYDASSPKDADTGRLDFVYSPGLVALAPADGAQFFYLNKEPHINFSWSVPDEISTTVLEIADNPDMNTPIRNVLENSPGYGGSFGFSGLGEGTWYWRVLPRYPDLVGGLAADSGIRSFSIGRRENLPAPVPLTPAEYSAVYTGPGRSNIYFSWKAEPEAGFCTVLISDSPDMRNPVVSQAVGRNFYLHNTEEIPLEPGTWYWSVLEQGRRENGIAGRVVPFYVRYAETAPRTIFPPDNYSIPANRSQDIKYSWKNTLPNQARVQIAPRADFTEPLLVNETVYGDNMRGHFLKPGTYYWRISAGSGSSRMDSPPSRLVVLPALKAPEIESPVNRENLRMADGAPVLFSWQRVSYADYYQFRLYMEGRPVPLCDITSLRDNRLFVHFDPRTVGVFRWTVQAFSSSAADQSGRAGLIGTGNFTVGETQGTGATPEPVWAIPRIANMQSFSGNIRSPITLLSPPAGTEISGVTALRAPPTARWRSDEPLRNTQLLVSRSFDPIGDPKAIVLDAGRRNSLSFPALGEGIWYWTIRADTSNERGVSSGDPAWFTVLPLPLFPAPRQTVPENGAVISLAQLTTDRQITFSWRGVPGANAYIFSLFGLAEPPELLLTSAPDSSLSFVLEDLTRLGQHNSYFWQAEAVYQNASGAIEQRGVIEQHRFSLELSHSDDVRTYGQQGPLYGQ